MVGEPPGGRTGRDKASVGPAPHDDEPDPFLVGQGVHVPDHVMGPGFAVLPWQGVESTGGVIEGIDAECHNLAEPPYNALTR